MKPPDLEEIQRRAQPKLEALLRLATGKKTLLAQTHDFPDPDTIASALALKWLMGEILGIETTIGYGGTIGRAENRAMIRTLNIKMRRTQLFELKKYDLVALLDTQPTAGNNCVPDEFVPHIVFDHHFPRELGDRVPEFFDVGGDYGATSTILTELIIASKMTPPPDVATALFYGVKSDTMSLGRDTSPADVAAYLYLFPLMNTAALSDIEHPQVPVDYFKVQSKAIARAKIYGTMVVSDLGEVYTPDLCSEIADRMLQIQGVNHALSVGWYEESLFLSLRTRSRAKNAGKILHRLVAGANLGTAGGHGPMAGARIPVHGRSQRARADIRRKLVHALVKAFGQDNKHFSRMVSRSDTSHAINPPPPKEVKEVKKPAQSTADAAKIESKEASAVSEPVKAKDCGKDAGKSVEAAKSKDSEAPAKAKDSEKALKSKDSTKAAKVPKSENSEKAEKRPAAEAPKPATPPKSKDSENSTTSETPAKAPKSENFEAGGKAKDAEKAAKSKDSTKAEASEKAKDSEKPENSEKAEKQPAGEAPKSKDSTKAAKSTKSEKVVKAKNSEKAPKSKDSANSTTSETPAKAPKSENFEAGGEAKDSEKAAKSKDSVKAEKAEKQPAAEAPEPATPPKSKDSTKAPKSKDSVKAGKPEKQSSEKAPKSTNSKDSTNSEAPAAPPSSANSGKPEKQPAGEAPEPATPPKSKDSIKAEKQPAGEAPKSKDSTKAPKSTNSKDSTNSEAPAAPPNSANSEAPAAPPNSTNSTPATTPLPVDPLQAGNKPASPR